MQRFVVWSLCALFILCASAVWAQAIEAIATQTVNVRAGAGTEFGSVGTLQGGQSIWLSGRLPGSTLWVYGTTPSGATGWVFTQFLDAAPEALLTLPEVTNMPVSSGSAPTPVPPDPVAPAPAVPADPAVPAVPPPAPAPVDVVSGITGNARDIFQRGQQLGNRANVFSKIGDSITYAPQFLAPFGYGAYNLRDYTYLQPVVDFFASGGARTGNAFTNESLAANNGWSTVTVLDPGAANTGICEPFESPLVCEYRIVRPSVALIMLGTNDLGFVGAEEYRANLSTIIQTSIDMGVIPVVSTIPLRTGAEGTSAYFNQIIAETTRYYDVPLWDFESALRGLSMNGLMDGVHPSIAPGTNPNDYGASADFTPDNLRYGYTVRNLTALQVLDAVWRAAMN